MNNSIQDEIINLCSVSNNKFKQDEIIIDNIYKRLKIIMIECYSWRENMPLNKIVNLNLKMSNNINLINNIIILSLYCNILGERYNINYKIKQLKIESEKDIKSFTFSLTTYNMNLYNKYLHYVREQLNKSYGQPYVIWYFKIAFFIIENLYHDYKNTNQQQKDKYIRMICLYTMIGINIFKIRRKININSIDINKLRQTCPQL
jgi:hypothetical protein